MEAGPWNWLEVAKLATGGLTSIVIAVLGVYLHRVTKRFEYGQWRSQKLIEKRLAIYDEIAPLFNDLLCYFTYVGAWRTMQPPKVVECKRLLDKKVHLAAPLFSPGLFDACMAFQRVCFETYQGWGVDALLRTAWHRRHDGFGIDWEPSWTKCFSEKVATSEEVRTAYKHVMEAFAVDIGVREVV